MNPILGPKTLTDYILNQTAAKSKKSNLTLLLQGILAGLYIAIGAVGSIKVSASFPAPGLGDFLGAVVFPVGIIAIIVMQAELYTSNCMIMASVYAGQSKLKQIVKILSLILFANLLGAVIASGLTVIYLQHYSTVEPFLLKELSIISSYLELATSLVVELLWQVSTIY